MSDREPFPLHAAPMMLPALGLSVALLVGCGALPDSGGIDALTADPGRSVFQAVALPGGEIVGADPLALAQGLYGISEPVEGNYTEQVELLSETSDRQVVLFTQVGLPDDSVRGRRHRLEFEPQGAAWQLTWAGRQVQCWPGRGHENWGTDACL